MARKEREDSWNIKFYTFYNKCGANAYPPYKPVGVHKADKYALEYYDASRPGIHGALLYH